MQFKDYYKVMGLEPEASQDDIKRAYRKLARKYHPDVSKEKNAEERFKELGEAYEVLKDPEKRASYDKLRKGGWQAGQDFTPPPNWQHQGFEGGGFTEVDPEQFSDFFSSLFGGGGFGRAGTHRARAHRRPFQQRGEDLHYRLQVTLEEAYHGGTRTIKLQMPEYNAQGQLQQKVRELNVKIPAGVTSGQKIRLRGQGSPGAGGAENGDFYLEIELMPHHLYALDGRNVTLKLPIAPWEAALGASVTVPTLGGKIDLKIPPNSQTGNRLRLKGRGLPGNPVGDQYVILQIVVPPADSEVAKKLYQEMAQKLLFNPRANLGV